MRSDLDVDAGFDNGVALRRPPANSAMLALRSVGLVRCGARIARFDISYLRLALIGVLPLPDFILVATQTFGTAQPIPQVGMTGQCLS